MARMYWGLKRMSMHPYSNNTYRATLTRNIFKKLQLTNYYLPTRMRY